MAFAIINLNKHIGTIESILWCRNPVFLHFWFQVFFWREHKMMPPASFPSFLQSSCLSSAEVICIPLQTPLCLSSADTPQQGFVISRFSRVLTHWLLSRGVLYPSGPRKWRPLFSSLTYPNIMSTYFNSRIVLGASLDWWFRFTESYLMEISVKLMLLVDKGQPSLGKGSAKGCCREGPEKCSKYPTRREAVSPKDFKEWSSYSSVCSKWGLLKIEIPGFCPWWF